MIAIRPEQMKVLSEAALKSFEDRMMAHLTGFFPRQCKEMGEKKTREAIHRGIAKAKQYGIVSEHDVCVYIDVMFEYGSDFDVDPELPWASQILADRDMPTPTYRINRLFDAAMANRKSGAKVNE
jgi:hypothetical protein